MLLNKVIFPIQSNSTHSCPIPPPGAKWVKPIEDFSQSTESKFKCLAKVWFSLKRCISHVKWCCVWTVKFCRKLEAASKAAGVDESKTEGQRGRESSHWVGWQHFRNFCLIVFIRSCNRFVAWWCCRISFSILVGLNIIIWDCWKLLKATALQAIIVIENQVWRSCRYWVLGDERPHSFCFKPRTSVHAATEITLHNF